MCICPEHCNAHIHDLSIDWYVWMSDGGKEGGTEEVDGLVG